MDGVDRWLAWMAGVWYFRPIDDSGKKDTSGIGPLKGLFVALYQQATIMRANPRPCI